jgi:hypothetical protein
VTMMGVHVCFGFFGDGDGARGGEEDDTIPAYVCFCLFVLTRGETKRLVACHTWDDETFGCS